MDMSFSFSTSNSTNVFAGFTLGNHRDAAKERQSLPWLVELPFYGLYEVK